MSTRVGSLAGSQAVAEHNYLRQVFAWMLLGLAITTGVAIYFSAADGVVEYFEENALAYFVVIAAQLGAVIFLSAAINRISSGTAAILFCLYSGLVGVTFSLLLAVYTTGSIVAAFGGATGVFGGMALFGYVTKRDLSGLGAILFGALIGLLIASIVFIFVGGSTFNLILGWAGVIIFAGLTAYDMQKLKRLGERGIHDQESAKKLAIIGALTLYLDFINLALSLLRIFGRTR